MNYLKKQKELLNKMFNNKSINEKEFKKMIDNILKLETTYKLFYKKKEGFYNNCLTKDIKKEYKNKLNDPEFYNNLIYTDGFSNLRLYYYDILENNKINLISNLYNDFILIVQYFIDFNKLDVKNLNYLIKRVENIEPD